ncbi:L-ectoine synthase [Streptomyces luteoverticillatus]|uniref:L-ectoine synthase n=1 Tax=Streptomyces luteoverticillatus TaxID=66425 RepID=A0A3S9PEA4_STRLT|nr:ectoine synthase [Streptomyces luteoverticillatus]AZQ70671.1 L-ectoine synthase [Streptomyces luteoverticillatus]
MFTREKDKVQTVEWGNGRSSRLLTESDGMGFTVADTLVRAGTKSRLQYRRHLEACYCISGRGEVISADGSKSLAIEPGVLYALDEHDAHFLIADPDTDLHLISVFNPPLRGDEVHSLDESGFSHY